MVEQANKKKTLGVIGIVAGFLALSGAFLSPWIQDMIDPPDKPLEEAAVDLAARLADAAKAKLKGEDYVPAVTTEPKPSRFLFPSVIGLGMLAAGCGIASLLTSEPKMIGGGAIALGLSAAVVQWSIMIAGVLVLLLLVVAILSFLGGG